MHCGVPEFCTAQSTGCPALTARCDCAHAAANNKEARLVYAFSHALIVATFFTRVSVFNNFTRDSVGQLQVLSELCSKRTHFAGRLRLQRAEIHRQTPLPAEREAVWREARLH